MDTIIFTKKFDKGEKLFNQIIDNKELLRVYRMKNGMFAMFLDNGSCRLIVGVEPRGYKCDKVYIDGGIKHQIIQYIPSILSNSNLPQNQQIIYF